MVLQHIRHHWTFLQYIVRKQRWKVGVELGLDSGRTFKTVLDDCPQLEMLYGVDCFGYLPDAPGGDSYKDTDHEANFAQCMDISTDHRGRAKVLDMTTHEASELFDDHSVDFVFIDADHSYDAVKQDIEDWWPKIKPGGWMLGHDYSPRHWPGVVKATNEAFGEPKHIALEDCLPVWGFVAMPFNVWGKRKPWN